MRKKSTIHDVIDALEDALGAAADVADGSEIEDGGGKEAVVSALTAIRSGRHADAVTSLEREFLPKWKDRADCEAAYRRAMSTTAQAAA